MRPARLGRREHPVGRLVLDFYCDDARLCVEVDGNGHMRPRTQREDRQRDADLKAAGYTVNHTNEADEKNPGVWGDSEMIYIDPTTHTLMGGNDQRHHFGKAAGY